MIDAFPRPPQFRAPDRQAAGNKRRSLDSAQLLGSVDDIRWDDPVFVLRRATSYRNSTSRRRSSAPLDEIALQHLHRESSSSYNSELQSPVDESRDKGKQPSRQEIIAAQRAATRATQRAIVTASTNSVRGMDVVLPGNARLRSARYEAGDRMRYSYVEPDGETYDISDIMEQEWRGMDGARGDLLEGVFNGNKDGISEKLDRVLNKIRKGKGKERERDYASLSSVESNRLSTRSVSISEYSADDTEEGRPYQAPENNVIARATPVAAAVAPSPPPRVGANTPTGGPRATPNGPVPPSRRNPSISSVLSDQQQQQGRGTPPVQSSLARVQEEERAGTPRSQQRRRLVLPKDDFGLAQMMAIIEYKALRPTKALPPLDPVDALLFGRPVDLEALHPAAREIYGPEFKHLEEIDKVCVGCVVMPRGIDTNRCYSFADAGWLHWALGRRCILICAADEHRRTPISNSFTIIFEVPFFLIAFFVLCNCSATTITTTDLETASISLSLSLSTTLLLLLAVYLIYIALLDICNINSCQDCGLRARSVWQSRRSFAPTSAVIYCRFSE